MGDMVSEQISMSGRQSQLEAVPGNSDTSGMSNLMEQRTTDPHVMHMPLSHMESGLMDSASESLMQHVDNSNALKGLSDPMSFNLVPQHIPCQPSRPQFEPSVTHEYSSGGPIAALNSMGFTRLTGKRKSPSMSIHNGSASEKSDLPNKQVVRVQNMPWIQQFSPASIGPVQFAASSVSPRTQHVPILSKKAVHMESVPSKAGKPLANKKQNTQLQASIKAQNDVNESVRSKIRESLASALALVQQEDYSEKDKKSPQIEEANASAMMQTTAPAADTAVPVAEGTTESLSTGNESSAQKDIGGILLQETSSDTKMQDANQSDGEKFSDTKMKDGDLSDGQKSQFEGVFPRDDVSFSDNIFVGDDLLQGNGLSWVLDPVSGFRETTDNGTDAVPNLDDREDGRLGGKKSFLDPQLLASTIESELYKLFGGVNKKYKEKGRSLLFNLKDKSNPELRERVMSGDIPPERLCSMTAEELASKELSQWRQAKAEELAEMVVLRDTDIDVRRLVRKTHKGEFQVEIDPVESGSVDVSVGVSSRNRSRARAKAKAKESSQSAKSDVKKDESKDQNEGTSCTITIPSSEATDPMQGLSVDDEMKDEGFLPPIVSLDEFMESLNTEPPFQSPQEEDAEKDATVNEKSDSEVELQSKSSLQSPKEVDERDSPKSKPEKTNANSPKSDASVLSNDDVPKPKDADDIIVDVKGEKVWDGILQLSTSSVVSVTGFFKSGEKTQTREWPTLLEVKGRVRLSAFAKFLQQLPMSRSRALMVMYLACKDGISESQRGNLYEAAESYVADERVGYAEPAPGMELYLCPPRGESLDLLVKIMSKDQLDEVGGLDVGLIGVVVWRRAVVSPRAGSGPGSGSRHKPGSRRHHSSGSRSSALRGNKSSRVESAIKAPVVGLNVERAVVSMGSHGDDDKKDDGGDDDDDDVPPGFGPGDAKEDDDLPEFNFDSSAGPVSSSRPSPPPSQPPSMDQVRKLIHRYGNSAGTQPWNRNNDDDDDDDDDIPEWQPHAPRHQLPPPPPPHSYGITVGPPAHTRPVARPPPPPPRQLDGWWANPNVDGRHHRVGPHDSTRPRNRGF